MDDLPQLKAAISALSNEDLFQMVNEQIVNYSKEEITLAYIEMERRGILPNTADETSRTVMTPLGCLLATAVFIVEFFLIHQEVLSWPRAAPLLALVLLVAEYRHRPKPETPFWIYCLWSLCIVLVGSLALWDLPNLLRHRLPVELAFGIPALIYSTALYWLGSSYRRWQPKFLFWLIGCMLFTFIYALLMSRS